MDYTVTWLKWNNIYDMTDRVVLCTVWNVYGYHFYAINNIYNYAAIYNL